MFSFSLVADHIYFNSRYNMESFLKNIPSFLNNMPDYKPKHIAEKIQPKCAVLHFPIKIPSGVPLVDSNNEDKPLHILWPHRW